MDTKFDILVHHVGSARPRKHGQNSLDFSPKHQQKKFVREISRQFWEKDSEIKISRWGSNLLKGMLHSLSNTRSPKSQLLVLESTFYGELIFIVISAINTFPQYQRGLNIVAAPCIGTFSIVRSSEKNLCAPYIGSS